VALAAVTELLRRQCGFGSPDKQSGSQSAGGHQAKIEILHTNLLMIFLITAEWRESRKDANERRDVPATVRKRVRAALFGRPDRRRRMFVVSGKAPGHARRSLKLFRKI